MTFRRVVFALVALAYPATQSATLRVPAYTAYLAPDAEGARVSANREVAPFVVPHAELRWYGEFKHAGAVSTGVALSVPRSERVTFRMTVGNAHHDVQVVGADSTARVSFGNFQIDAAGYSRFVLSVIATSAAPNVKVNALVLDGSIVGEAHFNLDARRNAASVHIRYPTDSNATITGFYNEVVGVEDPVTTYYMACGFARGYFGMQVNSPTERRIIFSIWDAGDGTNAKDRSTVSTGDQTQLIAKGEGVVADVFGNEGTGGHSHLVYNWKTGSTQKFFVTAIPNGTHTDYAGYWFHPDKKQWQLIASFRAPKDGKGLRRLYSFSENFGGSTGDKVRKALYGPQWIRLADGTWNELTDATFSHDATGKENRLDRMMGVQGKQFFLQHGGFVGGSGTMGEHFHREASGTAPVIDLPPIRQ